jgi:hypothetical protein
MDKPEKDRQAAADPIKINKIVDGEDIFRVFQFYKHNSIDNDFKLNIATLDAEEAHEEATVLEVKFQTGGTATTARNGVFIEDLLGVAYAKLREFNDTMPSRENAIALTHIEEAILNLVNRKAERKYRDVYGTDKE